MHRTIATYIEQSNAHNFDGQAVLFTPDATVQDEGHTHRGVEEIRAWLEKTQSEYRFTLEPLDSTEYGSETIVTCQVRGDFPGSPINLRFSFTVEGDKIAALAIRE